MSTWRKKSFVFLVAAALLITWAASPALAAEQTLRVEEASAGSMIFDLVFLRPLGIVATGVGIVAFTVTIPFSVMGGNTGEAAQKLIKDPAKFTFIRPLGQAGV